jgi:hypothetical protein
MLYDKSLVGSVTRDAFVFAFAFAKAAQKKRCIPSK